MTACSRLEQMCRKFETRRFRSFTHAGRVDILIAFMIKTERDNSGARIVSCDQKTLFSFYAIPRAS